MKSVFIQLKLFISLLLFSLLIACSTNEVPLATENNSLEEISSPLEDKPTVPLKTVALEAIASLQLNPASVLLTAQGQEETLKIEAFDSSGQAVSLVGVELEWLNSNSSVLQVTPDKNNSEMATIRSLTDLGSAVLSVRSKANSELMTAPLMVTIAKIKTGVKLIPDDKVSFPTIDIPQGATPDNFTPPFFEEINGVIHVGTFPSDDVMALLEVIDGETLRFPLVLTNTTIAVGDILLASQTAGFMGRVLSVEVNGDFILAQLEEVAVFDVFDDIDISFNSEELISSGLTTSAQLESLFTVDSTGGGLDTLAFDLSKCVFEGTFRAAEINLGSDVKFSPFIDIRLSKDRFKFVAGIEFSFALKAGFDIQPSIKGGVKCPLSEPTEIKIPSPGILAAIVNPKIKFEYNAKIEGETLVGPRIAGQAEIGFSLLIQIGYDQSLANPNASKVDFKPKADAKFTSDLLNLIDDSKFKFSAGVFVEPKAGLQFGGKVLELAEAAAAFFGGFAEEKLKKIKAALFFDVIKGKTGPVASATWNSPKRVINSKGSKTEISGDIIFELRLEPDGLNFLLKKLKIKAIRVNLIKAAVNLGKFHRVFKPDEINVKSNCFSGVIDAEAAEKGICARLNEEVSFNIKVKYQGVPLFIVSDAPLERGEVWLAQDRKIFDIPNVSDATKTMTINVKMTKEVCDTGVLSFLAFNTRWFIPTSGYAGDVKLNCRNNRKPLADAIGVSTSKNIPINIDAVKFANDPDGDPLTVSVNLLPTTVGSARVNANNTINYAPKAGFVGLDRFNYTVDDGFGGQSTAQISVFVIDNNAPVIDSFTATPNRGTAALESSISLEVSDIDGDILKCVLDYGDGQKENINPCTNHTFVHTYLKAGTYTAKLTVDDSKSGKTEKTINIVVFATNQPPVAEDDEFVTQQNTPLIILEEDLLANDKDPEGISLTIVNTTAPLFGTLIADPDPVLTSYDYEPNEGFFGVDSFTYTVEDNAGNKDTAIVFIFVNKADNNTPIISEFTASPTSGEAPLAVNFIWNLDDLDGDLLACNMDFGDGNPAQDISNCANNSAAAHTYNKEGDYTVKLSANDGKGGRDQEILIISVKKGNQPPIAIDDTLATFKNTTLIILEKDLLINDSDPDGDLFSLVEVGTPQNGTLEADLEVGYNYDPNKDFVGIDFFTYKIKDSAGNEATATVSVLVIDNNNSPIIVDFLASPITGVVPITTGFEWLINEPDGDEVTCRINFGDGSALQTIPDCINNSFASHNYSKAGSYAITLTASDNKEGKDEATLEVLYKTAQIDKDISFMPIPKDDWTINIDKEVIKDLPIINIDTRPTFPRVDLRIGGFELQSTDSKGTPNNPFQDVDKITIGVDNSNDNKIDLELGFGSYSPNSNVTKIVFDKPLLVSQINNLIITYNLKATSTLVLAKPLEKSFALAALLLLIPFGFGLYRKRRTLVGFLLISTMLLLVSCSTSKSPQAQTRTHQLHVTGVDAWSEITGEPLSVEGLPLSSAIMTIVD